MLYAITVLAFAAAVSGRKHGACMKRRKDAVRENVPPHMEWAHPAKRYADVELPTSVDWRWTNGQVYTTWERQQHAPQYCGSCWAQAVVSATNDRLQIMNKAKGPEVDLAPQILLDCDMNDDGCSGGDPDSAFEWIMQNWITEEICAPYEAIGHTQEGRTCDAEAVCKNCAPGKTGCWAQQPYRLWTISAHGTAPNETAMMQALQDGPIVCGVHADDQFEAYSGFGIYNDTSGQTAENHAISLVGYGTENGEDYWIGRNSWGTSWGYYGFFRIVRGTNNMGIEEYCSWGIPNPTYKWSNGSIGTIADKTRDTLRSKPQPVLKHKFHHFAEVPAESSWEWYGGENIRSPLPQDYIKASDLPSKWVWNDVNGTNFLTLLRNQHLPQYCGSCWAFGSTSSLGDRMNIIRARAGQSLWPEINFSPQVLINEDGGGTCNGGNAKGVMAYIHNHGLPDETCQVYQAKNNPHSGNASLNVCYACVPTPSSFWPGQCDPVPEGQYPKYWVSEYGGVHGADNMKSEIYARGPIACGVDATQELEEYTGGIFSQVQIVPIINHIISVVGWGVTSDGEEYWVGRNSWGTYWGEAGWFRIKMYSDNLGIERDCTWGVPSTEQSDVKPEHMWRKGVNHFPKPDIRPF
jgi:cathepsin X